MILANLESFLIRHEGNRLKPYLDTVGKITIGIGRNLTDAGISPAESHYLLCNDISKTIAQCRQQLRWFDSLNGPRQMVIIDMVFNMGIGRFLGFHDTIAAIEEGDYKLAASRMLDSKWALQVGQRALEDANIFLTGEYVEGTV